MEKITLIENDKEVDYDVLFTVKNEKKNKNFIIYTDDTNNLYAAYYDDGKINYIDNKEDQLFIEKVIDIVKKEMGDN